MSETALPASSTSEKTILLLNRHFWHRIDEVAEKEEEDEGVEYDDTPGPKVVTTDEVDDENNDASDGDHLWKVFEKQKWWKRPDWLKFKNSQFKTVSVKWTN